MENNIFNPLLLCLILGTVVGIVLKHFIMICGMFLLAGLQSQSRRSQIFNTMPGWSPGASRTVIGAALRAVHPSSPAVCPAGPFLSYGSVRGRPCTGRCRTGEQSWGAWAGGQNAGRLSDEPHLLRCQFRGEADRIDLGVSQAGEFLG